MYFFVIRCSDILLHRACLINQSVNSILLGVQKQSISRCIYLVTRKPITLRETNIAPKNHWKIVLLGFCLCSGTFAVSSREGNSSPKGSAPVFL